MKRVTHGRVTPVIGFMRIEKAMRETLQNHEAAKLEVDKALAAKRRKASDREALERLKGDLSTCQKQLFDAFESFVKWAM